MSTPAERRERKQRRRSAGWALIGVATVATLVGIFAGGILLARTR